jgi:hypothetical protein
VAKPAETLKKAIAAGDLAAVKSCVSASPDVLEETLGWGEGAGFALNYAAFCNKPAIIEYLVADCGQYVNRNHGVSRAWTPLHHAAHWNAVEAAAMLLRLGADPTVQNEDHSDTKEFCAQSRVQEMLKRPREEQRRPRAPDSRGEEPAEPWTRSGPREVVHDRVLAGAACRVTDVFNFETRSWLTISRDLVGGGMSQSQTLFDTLPDDSILRPALDKLKELGGEARDEDLGSRRLLKTAKPGLGGA